MGRDINPLWKVITRSTGKTRYMNYKELHQFMDAYYDLEDNMPALAYKYLVTCIKKPSATERVLYGK